VQRAYRDDVGSQLVSHRTANPGTLGGAFDAWMQMQVTPRPEFDIARRGARLTGDVLCEALDDLLAGLGPPRSTVAQRTAGHRGPWTGPTSTLNDTELLRACWAIACLTEVYRAGLWPDSPLMSLPDRGPVDLLEMAGEDALDELRDLTALARRSLLPAIRPTAADAITHVAPTFSGSELMNADADLIVDGALVEMKTAQGIKTSAGRRATLTGITRASCWGTCCMTATTPTAFTPSPCTRRGTGIWPAGGCKTCSMNWPATLSTCPSCASAGGACSSPGLLQRPRKGRGHGDRARGWLIPRGEVLRDVVPEAAPYCWETQPQPARTCRLSGPAVMTFAPAPPGTGGCERQPRP
jgi:hypothetical protein